MWSRTLRTGVVAAAALAVVGGLLGGLLHGDDPVAGIVSGVALGVAVGAAAGLHLAVRSADARGVAARGPEAREDSVERQVWVAASSRTCVDAVSVMVLVALICAWSDDAALVRWLPLAAVGVVLVDLVVRTRVAWRARVGSGA